MIEIENILIADDHELVTKGICNVLNERFFVKNIMTFTNPKEAFEEAKKHAFDLYILDLEFKEMLGFELITSIRMEHPNARIIVITMHEEIWNIVRLLKLKINGVILKKSSSDYLEEAVKAVMDDKQFLCPRFEKISARNSAYKSLNKQKNRHPSQSELTVLKYIVEGYSSKEIAARLCVTEDTIEAHRKSLFVKLEARNVAHLVSIAIRLHLVD